MTHLAFRQNPPSQPQNKDSALKAYQDFKGLIQKDLLEVDKIILRKLESSTPLIPKIAEYIIEAGGKRLRPCLTLAATKLFSETEHKHYGLAAAVEFIHTATLLHDDVVDESDLRRGKASANHIFGNKSSILVGDFLFSRSFELMVESGSLETLNSLAKASSIIAEGEVLQLSTTGNLNTTIDTYYQVIGSKTAQLFASATEVSALITNRPGSEIKALYDYGYNLGMAFQIIDDALDYSAKQQDLGKMIGDDFNEGKMTLPVIHAYEQAKLGHHQDEIDFWNRTIDRLDQRPADFDHAMRLISKHNSLAFSSQQARKFGDSAKQALTPFNNHPVANILCDLIEFILYREF